MSVRTDAVEALQPRFLKSTGYVVVMAIMLASAGCLFHQRPITSRAQLDSLPELARLPRGKDVPPLSITPPPPPDSATLAISDTPDESPLKRLAMKAVESEKRLNNYICRVKRREQVNGKDQPEEIVQVRFRRGPFSIHLKWLGAEAKGREIVYVQGQYENKIHLLTGKGDILGAGKHLTFSIDNPLVRSKTHYPITEAGLGAATLRFVALMDA